MKRKANGEGTIFKRKDGRWSAQTYITMTDGTRKRVSVTKPEREAVKARLDEIMAQEKSKIPFAAEKWTVGAYLDYWLENVVPVRTRVNTALRYESAVRCHIKPTIGRKRLDALSVRDVQNAIEQLAREGRGGNTLYNYKQVLSSALGRAMREELISRNVAQLVELPKYEKRETVVWTAEQSTQFLQAASAHQWFVGYLMMLTYGLRRGEMVGLRWSDIDFGNKCFHIRQQINRQKGQLRPGSVKTNAGRRTLPLAATIETALREHARHAGTTPPPFEPEAAPGTQDLVLTSSTGAPVEPDNLRRAFYNLIRKAGLPKITLHATRHVGATMLKNLNVPAKDAQIILGHANISTTMQIYQHGDLEVQRRAIRDVESALHTDTIAAVRDNCCQKLLSNPFQAPENDGGEQDNRGSRECSSVVRALPCQIKRHADEPCREPRSIPVNCLPTAMLRQLRTHANTQILGAVAVKTAVKSDGDFDRVRELKALRRACGDELDRPARRLLQSIHQ
jgi:integrase